MPWKQMNIVIAILLLGYRIWVFRKGGKSISTALGLSFNLRECVHLAGGTLISVVAISSIFLFEWSNGNLQVAHIGPATALMHDFSTFIAVPLIEEFIFRCAMLGGLLVLVPASAAIPISALIFGGLHAFNQNATVLSVVTTSIGGLAYGIAFLITERIGFPLGLHFGWNYFQARVFGFSISGGFRGPAPWVLQHDRGPDLLTGGAYGPEGGLVGLAAKLLVLVLVTAWFVLERRLYRKNQDGESAKMREGFAVINQP